MSEVVNDSWLTARRLRMVEEQLIRRDIHDPRVIAAMSNVPRHLFVPEGQIGEAYADGPLSIGHGQTISQPYVVASMTQALGLGPESRVLEIGTGSGYQTAILAEIVSEVYTIEIIAELSNSAERRLSELGYKNIWARVADGAQGWPEKAQFDGILVAAAAPLSPESLISQIKAGGRLCIPLILSEHRQVLHLITRTTGGTVDEPMYDVRFVLMRGKVESHGDPSRS